MRDLERKIVELKDVKDQQLMKLKNFRPKKWVFYDVVFFPFFIIFQCVIVEALFVFKQIWFYA